MNYAKVRCHVCQNSKAVVLKDNHISLYECKDCSHYFTEIPHEKKEQYNDDYFLEKHKNWFNNPNYRFYNFTYATILGLVDKKCFRLIDVGCGKGDFLKYLRKINPDIELYGIDFIDNQHAGINFIKGDILDDFVEGKFDVIFSLEVIEHIDKPNLFIKKIKEVLLPQGVVFIATVNNNGLLYRIARFLDKIGAHSAYNRLYSYHHLDHYTNRSLKTLMELNGFEVIKQMNHNYPLSTVDIPEGCFIKKRIQLFAVGIIFYLSSLFGNGMRQVVVCRKKYKKSLKQEIVT